MSDLEYKWHLPDPVPLLSRLARLGGVQCPTAKWQEPDGEGCWPFTSMAECELEIEKHIENQDADCDIGDGSRRTS